MKKFSNWIGAGIGWAAGGPIGAALGYLIGSFIKGTNSNAFSFDGRDHSKTQSGDFEISLLFLAAVVIKSDGKILQQELDYVRLYFIQMYGEMRANNAFKLFKNIIHNSDLSTKEVCQQIRVHMSPNARLQLIHFLFAIAQCDENINESEIKIIKTISNYLFIKSSSFDSIKAMFYKNLDSAYSILEVEKSYSNEEIKTSYRKLIKKHHPDKLTHLGKEHLKGVEEKFQKIQEAYEMIKKKRNF